MSPEPIATCETCHNFQPCGQAQLPIGQKAVIFAVARHLKLSAETGCQSCLLVWNALSLFREAWDEQDLEDAIELQVSSGQPLLVLFRPRKSTGVYLDIYTDAGNICLFVFFRYSYTLCLRSCPDPIPELTLEDGQLSTIGPATSVQRYSGSYECLNIAAQWLQNCLAHHKLCERDEKAGLPSRLIDLGIKGIIQPRLIAVGAAVGEYVALSYCWGEDKTLTTTTENISAHMTDLKFTSLPNTYRDLMTVARSLKIRYAWIDALCIIQDDAQDWARETVKMCSIYENRRMHV
jgi:hypothetical protein